MLIKFALAKHDGKMDQLNSTAKPYLSEHVVDDYVLDKAGCEIVINANANLAEDYAKMHDHKISKHWFNRIKAKIDEMPPDNFDVALDVCCGSGLISLNCMKYDLFKTCYAIDINEVQVRHLKEKARKNRIRNLAPMLGDVHATHFENNTFDCVIGNSFLHHLPDDQSFLREMLRILKPGGILCLTHEPSISAPYWDGYIMRYPRYLLGKLAKQHDTKPILSDIWLYNEKDVCSMLNKAGFAEYKVLAEGKISSIAGSFVEAAWIRVFNRMPPIAIYKIRSFLLFFERFLFSKHAKDTFSSFTILARKPRTIRT